MTIKPPARPFCGLRTPRKNGLYVFAITWMLHVEHSFQPSPFPYESYLVISPISGLLRRLVNLPIRLPMSITELIGAQLTQSACKSIMVRGAPTRPAV